MSSLVSSDAGWAFQWVDAPPSTLSAHVSGRLRWNGIDLQFMADGLRGIDGRLAAPSLQTLSPALQQLVLVHFAAECLHGLAHGPLADLELESIQWHEQPLPIDDGLEFLVRRQGVRGATRGRVVVPDATGCERWIDALASLGWPLPAALSAVPGRLTLGHVCLTRDECARLEAGDLVWIDDAELSPQGLRVHFDAASGIARNAWIKRSELRLDGLAPLPNAEAHPTVRAAAAHAAPSRDGMRRFSVARGALVQRRWLHGATPLQRLSKPASAMTWTARDGSDDEPCAFQGRLTVVARRIGLRITRVQQSVAGDAAIEPAVPQEARGVLQRA